jgi:hypothetical protein
MINTVFVRPSRMAQATGQTYLFQKGRNKMYVMVETAKIGSDKEVLVSNGDTMPRHSITTSVSGISAEDWDLFRTAADQRNVTYRAALESAIAVLESAVRSGSDIDWRPIKIAPSRPIRIHPDTRAIINALIEQTGYHQNVIVATAMQRWSSAP